MGTMFLLLALIQLPESARAPSGFAEQRLAVGGDGGMALAYAGEGGGMIGGAGIRATLPVGERSAITARIMYGLGAPGGMYEIRWQRSVDWPGWFTPDYAGVGAAGIYWLETGFRGRVKPRLEGVSTPQVLSLTAGWYRAIGRSLVAPVEISAFVHPYGAAAASVSIGLTWAREGG